MKDPRRAVMKCAARPFVQRSRSRILRVPHAWRLSRQLSPEPCALCVIKGAAFLSQILILELRGTGGVAAADAGRAQRQADIQWRPEDRAFWCCRDHSMGSP